MRGFFCVGGGKVGKTDKYQFFLKNKLKSCEWFQSLFWFKSLISFAR